jgi:hypothetical protein
LMVAAAEAAEAEAKRLEERKKLKVASNLC